MLLFLLLPPMYSGSCLHDALTYNCPQLCVGAGPSMQLISSFPFLVTAHLSSVLPEFPQDTQAVFLFRGRAWFPHASLGRCCRSFRRHSGGPGKAWWRHCPLRRGHEIIWPASFSCTSLGTKGTLRVLFSVTSPSTNVSAHWTWSCCHSCSCCVTAAQSWWIHHPLWKWHEIIRPLRQPSVWEEDALAHRVQRTMQSSAGGQLDKRSSEASSTALLAALPPSFFAWAGFVACRSCRGKQPGFPTVVSPWFCKEEP